MSEFEPRPERPVLGEPQQAAFTDPHAPDAPAELPPPRPAGRRYPEVTVAAIVFAIIIGLVMNASITYAGLKIGFTIGGSAIAAVLGFGVLRGLLRRGTILETNIAQTAASAVNTSNSGVIFTVPVLLLLGFTLTADSSDFWLITAACVAGAILGAAFMIPLRKQMIDIERLRFPTGTGVSVILKSPGAGAKKSIVLLVGMALSAILYAPVAAGQLGEAFESAAVSVADDGAETVNQSLQGFGRSLQNLTYTAIGNAIGGSDQRVLQGESFDVGLMLGIPPQFQLVFALAPFALGAGYISGKPGLLVLAGGILAYFLINPLAYAWGWMPETVTAAQAPGYGFAAFNRPLGIGLLLGGAMMGILAALPAIREAVKSAAAAGKARTGAGADELGLRPLVLAIIAAAVLLFVASDVMFNRAVNRNGADPISGAAIQAPAETLEHRGYVIAFESAQTAADWQALTADEKDAALAAIDARPGLLSALPFHVRAIIIAIVGVLWIWFAGIIIAQCTGMTDWSPISGMALLTVVLVMLLAGSGAVLGAVLIGAALCVAATLAADMMADQKTGYLVGAQPRRQQIVELAVVGIGPIVSMLVILIIAQANLRAYGQPMGPGTPTSAPQAQALQAVIGGVQGGDMPYALYGMGALLGGLLGLGAFSGLGVLVGLSMYLPFMYIATYGIGCVAQMIVSKAKGPVWSESWGLPLAAGLLVGEPLVALVVNLIVLVVG